jgi:hypothetical protein
LRISPMGRSGRITILRSGPPSFTNVGGTGISLRWAPSACLRPQPHARRSQLPPNSAEAHSCPSAAPTNQRIIHPPLRKPLAMLKNYERVAPVLRREKRCKRRCQPRAQANHRESRTQRLNAPPTQNYPIVLQEALGSSICGAHGRAYRSHRLRGCWSNLMVP